MKASGAVATSPSQGMSTAGRWGLATILAIVWDCAVFVMIDSSNAALQVLGRLLGWAGLTAAERIDHTGLFFGGTPMLALAIDLAVDLLVMRLLITLFFRYVRDREAER